MTLDEFLDEIEVYFSLSGYNIYRTASTIEMQCTYLAYSYYLAFEHCGNREYKLSVTKSGNITRDTHYYNPEIVKLSKEYCKQLIGYIVKEIDLDN